MSICKRLSDRLKQKNCSLTIVDVQLKPPRLDTTGHVLVWVKILGQVGRVEVPTDVDALEYDERLFLRTITKIVKAVDQFKQDKYDQLNNESSGQFNYVITTV